MPRDNRERDQLHRSRTRGQPTAPPSTAEEKRRRQIRSWIILVTLIVAGLLGYRFLRGGGVRESTAAKLTCFANQNVTAFGDGVLYYDGVELHCLSSSGTFR